MTTQLAMANAWAVSPVVPVPVAICPVGAVASAPQLFWNQATVAQSDLPQYPIAEVSASARVPQLYEIPDAWVDGE